MDTNDIDAGADAWAMFRLIAVYDLPVPIWTSTDVLGRRFTTGLGRFAFDVVMPGPLDAAGFATTPTLYGRPVTTPDLTGPQPVWAQRFAGFTPGEDHESTALCRVALVSEEATADENGLARVVDSWFDDVRTWAEACTGQDLDPHHRVYDATAHGENLSWVRPRQDGDGPLALTLTTGHIDPLPADAWGPILQSVARGIRPPLEELLSRNARAAFHRGQYRRTVIDAASAVEIVLHAVVGKHMRPIEEAQPDWVRKKLREYDRQPLGSVVQIARYGDVFVGVNYSDLDTLITARNDALHRGASLDHLDTLGVLQTCNRVLGAVGPWRRRRDDRDDGSEWVVHT